MDKLSTRQNIAFFSAKKLNLTGDITLLKLDQEHDINSIPVKSELLLIRKSPDVLIDNEIGKTLKGHNLIEYKFTDVQMGNKMFLKAFGDACLYTTHPNNLGKIGADDTTISLAIEGESQKLINQLMQNNLSLNKTGNGIYQIHGFGFFSIQLIIINELDKNEQIWLKSIMQNFEKEDAPQLTFAI